MVLSQASGRHDEFVVLNGVRYPVLYPDGQSGMAGGSTPVATAPMAPFPESLILGDSSRSSDQRMAAYNLGEWRDGAGVFRYPAGQSSESLATFAVSDCDTRFERSLVCRRLPTVLGSALGVHTNAERVVYTGYAGATLHAYGPTSGLYYWSGAAWTAVSTGAGPYIGGLSTCYQIVQAGNYLFAASNNIIAYTNNGTTWTSSATPLGGTAVAGITRHDNKLWCVTSDAVTVTLYQSTNALATPGAMTWTAATGGTLVLDQVNQEFVAQLGTWRNRYGVRCLFCLTTRHLYLYDEDGQAWQEFFDFTPRNLRSVDKAYAYVWPRDDNLYIAVNAEGIYQLTGTAVDFLGPNIKGGIPLGHRTTLAMLGGNSHNLFAWGGTPSTDSTSKGGTWALNQQGGWHRVMRDTTASDVTEGGGWGNDTLYTVQNGKVYSQLEPDVSDIPMNAASGTYTYDTTVTQSHYTAIMDGGMPNIPIQPLYVELRGIKSSDGRSQGLATNTQVIVNMRTNLNTTWVSLGTLTSASVFPARLPINAGLGILLSDIDIRLDLSTTVNTATPIVTDVIVHFDRSAQVRSQYTLAIDLREDNTVFKQDAPGLPATYYYKTAKDLKASLYALAGLSSTNNYRAQIVPFSYGGGPLGNGTNAISLTAALVRVASSEDPLLGDGIFRIAIEDLTTPASGT